MYVHNPANSASVHERNLPRITGKSEKPIESKTEATKKSITNNQFNNQLFYTQIHLNE